MKILFVSVFILAAVGMWFLCRNDENARRVSAGSPTSAPNETVAATPTATPTTAPSKKAAKPTIAPTKEPTKAPTAAPEDGTPKVVKDRKPIQPPADPAIISAPDDPIEEEDPIAEDEPPMHVWGDLAPNNDVSTEETPEP